MKAICAWFAQFGSGIYWFGSRIGRFGSGIGWFGFGIGWFGSGILELRLFLEVQTCSNG